MDELFRRFAFFVSHAVGSVWAAVVVTLALLISGWHYGFTWEWENNVSDIACVAALYLLIILQKSQNHSDKATHLKLDELIRSTQDARNEIVAAETQPETEMERLKQDL